MGKVFIRVTGYDIALGAKRHNRFFTEAMGHHVPMHKSIKAESEKLFGSIVQCNLK